MNKWTIDKTITLPYVRHNGPFLLVIAFTKNDGNIKVTGNSEDVEKELKKFPTCHAFQILYSVRRKKSLSWRVVGNRKLNPEEASYTMHTYGTMFSKKGFYLVRSTGSFSRGFSEVIGSWRKLPAQYLKEFDGERHKNYPFKRVLVCPKCRCLVMTKDKTLDWDDENQIWICRHCQRSYLDAELENVEVEILGGTQVSAPLKFGRSIDYFHNFKADATEKQVAEKRW